MGFSKYITLAISTLIVVILTVSVLLPIIDAESGGTVTYENEGRPYTALDENSSHTIVVTSQTDITVDGVALDLSSFPEPYYLLYSDKGVWRLDPTSLVVYLPNDSAASFNYSGSTTITVVGNTATCSTTSTEVNYMLDPSGDLRLSDSAYIYNDSTIAGLSLIRAYPEGSTDRTSLFSYYEGTIDNMAYSRSPTGTAEFVGTFSTEAVAEDIIKINSFNIAVEATNTSNVPVYGNMDVAFLAPASVSYTTTNDLAGLIAMLPVLILVGVVVGFVGLAFANNRRV